MSVDAASAMDRMYRWQRPIYDLTRKPYLLGRDRLIADLAPPAGGTVLEIGCGTGRNLVRAARLHPQAAFYGFDVSSVMLAEARDAVARAGLGARIHLDEGDATSFDPQAAFGIGTFDRVFISYALSMIPPWRQALAHAAGLVAPAGRLEIVDFGMGEELSGLGRGLLHGWLRLFHVAPRPDLEDVLAQIAGERGRHSTFRRLYGGYAVLARID